MLWINLAGLGLIFLIVWWFWLYQAHSTVVEKGKIEVLVKDGVYQPANLTVAANTPVQIIFYREDATPCAETLLIPDLNISETLPLRKNLVVSIPASSPGNYPFHCQMNMYKGMLIVE